MIVFINIYISYKSSIVLAFYLFIYFCYYFNSIRKNHCKAPQNNYLDGALYKKSIIIIVTL